MKKTIYIPFIITVISISIVFACKDLDNRANDYKLERENIDGSIRYNLYKKDYCTYSIKPEGAQNDGLFIVLDQQGNRILEREIVIRSIIALKTKEYIDREYLNLEGSFDRSYDKLRSLEVSEKAYFDTLSASLKSLQGEYADICITPIPSAEWIKICIGETLKNLIIQKNCNLFFSCLDWDSTINKFRELRGNVLELKSDTYIYQDEIDKFYETGVGITKFLGVVDQHSGQQLVLLFSSINLEDFYTENYQISDQIPLKIEQRIQTIKTEVLGKKDLILIEADSLKSTIKNYQNDGYMMSKFYGEVCKIKNSTSNNDLFEKEEFNKIRENLSMANASLNMLRMNLGSIPIERHNLLQKLISRIILYFWSDC